MKIFTHYLYRTIKHPVNLAVYLLLPAVIIALNVMIFDGQMEGTDHIVNGFNLAATAPVIQIMVMFQLFGTSLVYDHLYADFRSDRRWRLLAAPKSLGSYLRANLCAAVIVSMVSGTVLMLAGRFIFNAYLFNVPVLFATMFALTALAMGVGLIIFLVTEKKSAAEGLAHAFVWPQFIPIMMGLAAEGPMHFIFQRATPAALGMNAIAFSSGFDVDLAGTGVGTAITDYDMTRSLTYLGILFAIAAVVWVVAMVMGKHKKF